MEFKQLEAFVSVIKYGSFSKAADASFLAQPTISAHISSLEKELGVILIDRLGKESRPTKEGEVLYKYALDIIHSRDEANRAVNTAKKEMSGVLEVQASSIPGQYLVPVLMAQFKERHKRVRFYLEQSDSRSVINSINQCKGEIGFSGYYRNNELVYHYLCRDTCVIITPKTARFLELKENKRPVSLADFADEAFIWREKGSATRKVFEEKCAQQSVSIRNIATMNSIGAIETAVSNGMGISVLSEMGVKRSARAREFLSFILEDDCFDRSFYLIYKKNITLSPVASEFKQFVLDYFSMLHR